MNKYRDIPSFLLESQYHNIDRRVELLQEKLGKQMSNHRVYSIVPENFELIPEINMCSIEDLEKLDNLISKSRDLFWELERRDAENKGTLEQYYAERKLYYYLYTLDSNEQVAFLNRCSEYCNQRMTTHKVIRAIMEAPNFIEEVNAL